MCIRLPDPNRWGSEYDGTLKKTKYDAQGNEIYPDSSSNMHSGGASGSQQEGMKIGGPEGKPPGQSGPGGSDSVKGDEPLTDNPGKGGGGSTDDINY